MDDKYLSFHVVIGESFSREDKPSLFIIDGSESLFILGPLRHHSLSDHFLPLLVFQRARHILEDILERSKNRFI